jgi:uncharacterized protein
MSERNGYAHGVPCWVDTWVADPDGAAAFYGELMGWDAARGEYSMFRHRGRDVAGLGAAEGLAPAWTTYVWVDDADASAETARAAGGRLVREPFDSLDGGRIALVADPAGAVIGVWQVGEHRGARVVNEPGAWSMSALSTPDPEGAKAFYAAVFGWTTSEFGPATMFHQPGFVGGEPQQPVPRDVVAAIAPSEAAPRWLIDFWVDDVDAAAGKAAPLGGRVVAPPFATPAGRSAVIADPAGAEFTITQIGPPA